MIYLALFGIAAVIFALGLWFFTKFLVISVFPFAVVDQNEPIGADHALVFGHHAATIIGGTTILGVGIGLAWGWAPAFLWIVAATAVLAGTLAIGGVWIREHYAPEELFGVRGAVPLYGLLGAWLLCINPLLALTVASSVDAVPSALLPVLVLALFSRALAGYLSRIPMAATAVAVIGLVLIIATGQAWPLSINGTIVIDLAGFDWALEPYLLLLVVILALAHLGAALPAARLGKPKGYLVMINLTVFALAALLGLVVTGADMSAPPYHRPSGISSPVPLLFVAITGGAVAAFHALVEHTGAPTQPIARARFTYGIAVADGVVAILILFVVIGSITGEAWERAFATWPLQGSLDQWALRIIDASAGALASLGIPPGWGRGWAAFTIASLAMVTLEAGFRVQQFLLDRVAPPKRDNTAWRARRGRLPVVAVGVLAVLGSDFYLSL
ncbi:MAG: hypothetical protein OEN20_08060, partial [Gammaproteobacteria bacterium]|nr:hypothetical protein [Gammaproteobacteria bacterium]